MVVCKVGKSGIRDLLVMPLSRRGVAAQHTTIYVWTTLHNFKGKFHPATVGEGPEGE